MKQKDNYRNENIKGLTFYFLDRNREEIIIFEYWTKATMHIWR